jgi:uncharacterized small protein (DUF1192 family)
MMAMLDSEQSITSVKDLKTHIATCRHEVERRLMEDDAPAELCGQN